MGNQFSAYQSLDGNNWEIVLSTNINMSDCILIGMITMNGTPSGVVTGIFENVSINGTNGVALLVAPISRQPGSNVEWSMDFSVFPNPAANVVNVNLEQLLERSAILRLYSTQGQILLQRQWEAITNPRETIDISTFAPGTYLLEVISGTDRMSKKLLIVQP